VGEEMKMAKCECHPACLSDDPIPSEETAALGRKAAELIAEKDIIITALREENDNLRNRFQQLAGGFEIQGDHKSAERVRAAM
jgi:hypothetical protein